MSEAYAAAPVYLQPQPKIPRAVQKLIANIKSVNIAKDLEATDLAKLGAKVVEEYEIDQQSLEENDWKARHDAALKLALQVKETKNYPWPGAANVKYPLVTVAAIQFNARALLAIIDGPNIVKGQVLGKPDDMKRDRADRIARHMSYQLLDEMPEWEEETDKLLLILPVTGNVFRKTYFDPSKQRNVSEMVTADRFVVNYWAKPLAVCPRSTEVCTFYPHQIVSKVRSGLWLDPEIKSKSEDDDAPETFLEQHRLWDLDEDGYPEPYIVTVHKETMKVVRIVARYDEDGVQANAKGEIYCIEPVRYYTKYGFIPSMDGSFYDIGFGMLLGALNETINATLNQLLDAGHLANTQGGFIGAGAMIKGGNLRFSPGEWKRVDVPGSVLKDSIVPLPAGEPSAVLFNLLGMLIESAKDITATKDILTGETQGMNVPVGTVLATIEQGLKAFTAIYKRVHRSLKDELACLFRLNRLYLDPQVYFNFQDEEGAIAQQDYASDDVGVIPVSDPTIVTDMQRIKRAEFGMQFVGKGMVNDQVAIKNAVEAAGLPNAKELLEVPPPPPNMELEVKKAELAQKDKEIDQKDHELEIATHGALRAEREMAIKEATAKAANSNTYATMLATLADIGLTTSKNPETGETTTVDNGLSPGDMALMSDLHDLATSELEAETDAIEPGPDLQQPQGVPGMEGPSPDGPVPGVPEGPPMGDGPEMGAGEPVDPAAAGGSYDPGMGGGPVVE